MSSKVEVLCPNGHWVNVKITPNTKVLQVLEEACAKKGFLPASDYEIRHGKKILDTTLAIRYTGIPNNAKLEIVKGSQTRTESDVVVALQLPDGERLVHSFSPNTTLWDILKHCESSQTNTEALSSLTSSPQPDLYPACIFMREEVVGEFALQETTLRNLGLNGGKAILRLMYKKVSASELEEIRSKIEKELERQKKIAEQSKQQQQQGDSLQNLSVDEGSGLVDMIESQQTVCGTTGDASGLTSTEELMEVEQTAPTPRASAVHHMTNRSDNPGVMQSELYPKDRVDVTQAISSQPPSSQPTVDLEARAEQIRQVLQEAIRLPIETVGQPQDAGAHTAPSQEATAHTPPAQQQSPAALFPLMNFKFPEETKGKDVYHNEMTDVSREDFQPCPRETIVFSLNDPELEKKIQQERHDVGDEFFELTDSDLKRMWADLQRKLQDEQEQMLMTQSMKKAAREARMDRYQRVAIRVHFPQRIVLQGLFRPRETVFAIYKFVKDHLEEKNLQFYLYTTPPRQVLKDHSKTLIQANLAPMSNVHFGCDEKLDGYLSRYALSHRATLMEASQILVQLVQSSCHEVKSTEAGTSAVGRSTPAQHTAAPAGTMGGASTSRNASAGTAPVPKWFKMGKK